MNLSSYIVQELNFRQILTRVHKAKADSGLMADADFGSARDELEDQTRTQGLQECPAFSGRRPCPKLRLGEHWRQQGLSWRVDWSRSHLGLRLSRRSTNNVFFHSCPRFSTPVLTSQYFFIQNSINNHCILHAIHPCLGQPSPGNVRNFAREIHFDQK